MYFLFFINYFVKTVLQRNIVASVDVGAEKLVFYFSAYPAKPEK